METSYIETLNLRGLYGKPEQKHILHWRGAIWNVEIHDNMFINKFPIDDVEFCVRLETGLGHTSKYYLVKKGDTFSIYDGYRGMLVDNIEDVILIRRKDVIRRRRPGLSDASNYALRCGIKNEVPIILKINNLWHVYDFHYRKFILENCESISYYPQYNEYCNFFEFRKSNEIFYMDYSGTICFKKSDMVFLNNFYGIITQGGKFGIYHLKYLIEYVPIEFDHIEHVRNGIFILTKNGISEKIDLAQTNYDVTVPFEKQTYDNYQSSYAQRSMGYSDDDIETIFDGDPSAYWNID